MKCQDQQFFQVTVEKSTWKIFLKEPSTLIRFMVQIFSQFKFRWMRNQVKENRKC